MIGLQTSLANLSPDNQRGAFIPLNAMVLRISQTLGPLIMGIGYSFGEMTGVYYLSAFVAFIGLVVFLQ